MKSLFTLCFSLFLFANSFANSSTQPLPPPVAQFNASAYSGCAPLTVTFYNSSEGNGTYSWDFGDPLSATNTSIACSPTHTFVNPGSYLVTLTYLYNSTVYTDTATIRVWPLPNPLINGADTTCSKSTKTYTATGFAGSSYYWSVTGGAIVGPANTATVVVNWTTPGVGMLTVNETSIYGCSNTSTLKVLVAPQPELGNICESRKGRSNGSGEPNGKPSQLPCKCENSLATFQALGPDNFTLLENDLYTFQWTVTGGTITSGAGTNSIQVLVGAGPTMTVSLVVFNQFGCIDSSQCVYDVCKAPVASFTADTACFKGQTSFNGAASSVQSQIVGYSWDFGDNTTNSTLTNYTNYIYGAPGTYYATLTVKNMDGCFDDTIVPVLVQPGEAPPITCVGTVCHGTKKCYNTPYFPGATYTWTVTGNVLPVTYQGDTVVCVTWGNGPLGTITLEVVGGPYLCGKNTVNVPIFPSSIAIYGPDTICTGSPFSYSTDIIPGSCYSWSVKDPFGNVTAINPSNNPGNQISGITPNNPGTYEITLNMNNDLVCCHGSVTRKIVVQAPIQLFGVFTLCEYDSANYFSSVPVSWSVTNGIISASTPTSCTIHWGGASYGTITATALNPDLVCDNYATYSVTLIPKPDALPIYGNTLVCKGSTEIYTHDPLASGVTSVFAINPVAGVTVINTSPLKVKFNSAGSYTVSVVYTNASGCSDTSYLNITVLDTLKPSIIGPVQVCKGSTYVYTMSSNPGNAWQWNAIGGQILYQSPDSLVINWGNINQGQVNIQNTLCGGFNSISVNVNAIPTGLITVGAGSCKGDTVRLSGPPGYSYLWSTSATSQSIIATNPSSSFWVILGKNGCFDTLYKNLSPFPQLPKPNVNIIVNCMLAPSTPVPYQMTATYNANWHYSWSPITAIPSNSDTTNTHFDTVFNSVHTVIVTNEFGCKDTASVQLTTSCVDTCVGPNCGGGGGTPCSATFSVQYNPCSGVFSFTQLSGNTILAVLWNFGDGDYSNNFSPTHFFATTGTHTVTLSVFCGTQWITQSFNINVPYILLPKIKHTFPNWCDYNTISLTHAVGSVVLGATSESVDWGIGPLTYGSLPQTHTYASAGTYIITYTVSAPGCTRVVYDTAVILPFNAAFGFCDSGCVGQAVQFIDHSTTATQYPIVNWDWTFGDLTGSNLQSPFHIYNTTGTFAPQLVVQNQQGCKDSISLNIVITTFNAGSLTFKKNGVSVTLPANSTFDICEGDTIEAIAPTAALYTYAWNNGVSTTIDSITKSGKYWVVIANGRGCTDTLGPFYVIVNPVPFASIIASDTFCLFSTAKLSALPGPGYTYVWTSNPPNAIAGTNPTFFPIGGPGDYMITLQVTNLFGCTAVDSQKINITPAPIVNITANTTAQLCEGDSLKLTANISGAYTSGSWSTGETTLSIWVRSNGTYSFTAQNAFGCTYTDQYTVSNIAKRPDLSNVPKGCYKLCCKPGWNAVVCGPYPKPGQGLYYKWFKNNLFYTNTQNININSSGDYHVQVIDSASNCASISAQFSVDCTGTPIASILSSSPNPTLCKGVDATIDLEADSLMEEVIYTWFLNGVAIETGPVYSASEPGTYTLVAYFSECCSDTDHVVISEGDCCFPPNTNFTLIQDSTVINSDVVWDGKYYVAGRVYVKGSAILDMTEIDVVFDRDGEIIFEDTSVIRATNSVFRPCDMYDAWQGFSFYDMSHGFVQANNFKSADSAILVKTYGPECVKLNDNFFSNCHVGITIHRQQAMPYDQAITNNSFVIDNYNFNTPALYNSSEFWGIRILSTQMQELVSQNQFRSIDFSSQGNMFYGILGIRSSAVMSENKFTNMYRGIDWTANSASTFIENNEFEQTYKVKFPSDYQIRLSDCTQPLLLFANEFRNSDNYNQSNTAIYAERVANMNIRDNNIKGFQHGIYTLNLSNCIINENDIDNSGRLGIYNTDSRNVSINCNIIRMKDFKPIIGGGGFNNIGISMQNGDASNRIFTNCIFDCRYSIYVRSTLVNSIPLIHNNYLYNYIVAGIRTSNHTGFIGTAASPGKNTFVSNNRAGGAVDIFGSGGAVVENCNFGILSIGGTASTGGACPSTQMYSSTASCGHQIVNTKHYKTDQWDICDIFNDNLEIIIGHGIPGQVKDSIKYQDNGNLVTKDRSKEELLGLSRVLINLGNKQAFDQWISELKDKKALNNFYLGLLNAEWSKVNISDQTGIDLLNSLSTQNREEKDLKVILNTAWTMELGIVPNASNLDELKSIDSERGRYAAMARDIIHLMQGNHDYIFDNYLVNEDKELQELQKRKNSFVSVIPNPASDKVSVKFKLENDGENEIMLTDISGRIIKVEVVTIEEGQYDLNISTLSPGMYYVVVKDTLGKKSYTAKLIKE